MKDIIPYAIVALISLGAGALLMNQCSKPEKITVTEQVLVTKYDTVKTLSPPKYIYRDRVKEITQYEYVTDPVARGVIDSLSMELWWCLQTETEASKKLPNGELLVGFSMPRFVQDQQTGLSIEYRQNPDTTQTMYVQTPRRWYERFGYGPQVGIGYANSVSWYAGFGLHYDFSGMFLK